MFTIKSVLVAAVVGCLLGPPAQAQIITNGGFESGFFGWTRADQLGSDGTFTLQSGTASPVNGLTVPAPPQGTQAAMTDSQGPGSHVLYQNFVVPVTVTSASINYSLFINNAADRYANPSTLDFATPVLNQQVRVDLLRASADPFSVAAGDVLANLYQTTTATPFTLGYTNFQNDITSILQANAGLTVRLRFAEVDNVNIMNLGVDQVSITTSAAVAPEPSSLLLAGSAVLLVTGYGTLRRRVSRKAEPRPAAI